MASAPPQRFASTPPAARRVGCAQTILVNTVVRLSRIISSHLQGPRVLTGACRLAQGSIVHRVTSGIIRHLLHDPTPRLCRPRPLPSARPLP
eukprot:8812015-Pyramimonas_sp.AAC.1